MYESNEWSHVQPPGFKCGISMIDPWIGGQIKTYAVKDHWPLLPSVEKFQAALSSHLVCVSVQIDCASC